MDILTASITIFLVQLVFIWSRTWNVIAIGKLDTKTALLSGAVIHLAWLASIAIGGFSMHKVINDFDFQYIPIIICSLTGGLYGTYLAIEREKKKQKTKTKPSVRKAPQKPLTGIINALRLYATTTWENDISYIPTVNNEYTSIHVITDFYPNEQGWYYTEKVTEMMAVLEIKIAALNIAERGVRLLDTLIKDDYAVFPISNDKHDFQVRVNLPEPDRIYLTLLYYYEK